MAAVAEGRIIAALVERHGRTYASEAGIDLRPNTPSPLFRLLCLSLLLSARIDSRIAVRAARGLAVAGWTTAPRLAAAEWADRVRVLDEVGYARYDERTSRMLGDTSELLVERYRGDLRLLRAEAGRDPAAERRLLQQFSGIGEVGAAIFAREVQLVWDEVYPFADRRALEVAERLGLGADMASLQRVTDGVERLTLVVAALVRCSLAGDADEIRQRAVGG